MGICKSEETIGIEALRHTYLTGKKEVPSDWSRGMDKDMWHAEF